MSEKVQKISKTPTRVDCTTKLSIANLFLEEFLGNLLMTLIDLVTRTAINIKKFHTGMFSGIEFHLTV